MAHLKAFQATLQTACGELWNQAEGLDIDGGDPVALCAPLVEAGLFRHGSSGSEDGGGWERDPVGLCDTLMAIGATSLPAARIFEGHVNAVKLVRRYGEPSQVRRLALAVADGAVCGVWNAEAPPGLRLIEGDGPRMRLDGGKIYASGIGLVTQPLVTARRPDGAWLMILPGEPSATDLSRWTARGMRATATGTVDYTGVEIAPEAIVGAAGDYYLAPLFKGGAWRFAAAQTGAVLKIQHLLGEGLARRGRDADPLQRARVGQLAIAAHTAQMWCREAASMEQGAEADPASFAAFVGLARTAVEAAAGEAIAVAERAMGLSALLRPDPLDRVIRDLQTYLRQPFPDAVLDEAAAHVASRSGVVPWSALAGGSA